MVALEARERTVRSDRRHVLAAAVDPRGARASAPKPRSSSTSSDSVATPTRSSATSPPGTRRIVELAGAARGRRARCCCLDEPTAGVAQRETEAFGPLIVAHPARARRRDARDRARHAAHHGHQRPRVLPRSRARSSPRARPSRSATTRRHRLLPRHRRARHRPLERHPCHLIGINPSFSMG